MKTINTNAIISNSLNNETVHKLKQNNIKTIINYKPSSNDQENATIQNLIELGVDGFNLINIQVFKIQF